MLAWKFLKLLRLTRLTEIDKINHVHGSISKDIDVSDMKSLVPSFATLKIRIFAKLFCFFSNLNDRDILSSFKQWFYVIDNVFFHLPINWFSASRFLSVRTFFLLFRFYWVNFQILFDLLKILDIYNFLKANFLVQC